MKRVGNIFEKICDIENIYTAIRNAARGKKHRRTVAYVLDNQEKAARLIQEMLVNKTYKPKPYRTFEIKDGPRQKTRTIFCPAYFPDQIIHWTLMQIIEPVLMRGMYEFCCGSIPNRGVHYGKRYLEKWIKRDRKHTKYYLRYMDDMTLFSNNKKQLHKARRAISEFIKPMGLTLKENWQVFRVDKRPIDFLGYKFYRYKTTLRRKNCLRIRRRVKRASKKERPSLSDARTIISYLGWIKHSNSYYFYGKYIKPYVNIKELKEVVSNESRKHNKTEAVQR